MRLRHGSALGIALHCISSAPLPLLHSLHVRVLILSEPKGEHRPPAQHCFPLFFKRVSRRCESIGNEDA
jgi:hypothetical protein